MIRHASETPKPLRDINPEVPDGLQLIVNYMMAKDPNGRYPTPDRAAQALQVFLAAGTEPARPIETEASMMQYLNWLETGGNRPQPSGGVPIAAAVARQPAGTSAGPPSGKHKKKRKKRKDKAPVAAGVAPPPPGVVKPGVPLGNFDVELVAVSPGTSAAPPPLIAPPVGASKKKPRRAGRMTRRNFILAAVGVGSVVTAVAAGGILASGGVGPFLHRLGLTSDDDDK